MIVLFVVLLIGVLYAGSFVCILLKMVYEHVSALVFVLRAAKDNPADFVIRDPESIAKDMAPVVSKSVGNDALWQAFDWAAIPAHMTIDSIYVFFYLSFNPEIRRRFYRIKKYRKGNRSSAQRRK